jgi:outer membrane protein assembly factor BamB
VPYKVSFDAASVTPVVHDGLVIFSSEQKPVEAHRIVERGDGLAAELAWTTGDAHFQFSSPVLAAGRLIGFSTRNKGQVVAIDPADGKLLWAGPPRQGENAFLIAAGPVVLVVRSGAELDVIDAGANAYSALASYQVGESWMWSHPALLEHALLVKDHDGLRRWELVPGAAR